MEKKITSTSTKGFIIAAVLIALDIIVQFSYKQVPDGVRYMPRVGIVFVGVLAACILYSKQSGSGLSFGEVFSHGFKIAAVVAFTMAAYTFICFKFIYPPPGPAEMEAAVKAIEQRGNALHQEAVQQAIEAPGTGG